MIKAFRDTWELGVHSYLSYLRNRLLLARELLSETGSVFIQISDENVHHVRELCDEIFGVKDFCREIFFFKTGCLASNFLDTQGDYLIWYAKNIESDDGELIHMTMKMLRVDGMRYLGSICAALNQIEPIYGDLEANWPRKLFQN